jgi:PTH1 family peptidyl-tRNA hydrolase
MPRPLKLVVGLGNPGPRYARTRHNVGFRVAERFAADHAIALDREAFGGRFGAGAIAGDGPALEVFVLTPLTFMNHSGDAVAEAVATLPVSDPSRDLLIVLDDVDLPFGRLRLRPAGGAGGHRGLADVISRIARQDVPRLRFGVGRSISGHDTSDHVLEGFSGDEESALTSLVARAAEAVALALTDGVEAAMNRYNPDPAAPASGG